MLAHEVFQIIISKGFNALFCPEDRFAKRVAWKRTQVELLKNKFFEIFIYLFIWELKLECWDVMGLENRLF